MDVLAGQHGRDSPLRVQCSASIQDPWMGLAIRFCELRIEAKTTLFALIAELVTGRPMFGHKKRPAMKPAYMWQQH
jgi:hypothetical protein